MPRIVDHAERRLQIARVVEELVCTQGIEALTIRAVAAGVGYSTMAVSHYFKTRLEMMLFTHQQARFRAVALLEAALEQGWGLGPTLEQLLPTTEERWRDWHIWFAFWGMAPATAVEQEWAEGTSSSNQTFARLIEAAQTRGEIAAGPDPAEAATQVQVCLNGIASLAVHDRSNWPAARQKAQLRQLLGALVGFRPQE